MHDSVIYVNFAIYLLLLIAAHFNGNFGVINEDGDNAETCRSLITERIKILYISWC
jgi:hypothetical protein